MKLAIQTRDDKSFAYKVKVLGYKIFTVYFKWPFCVLPEHAEDYDIMAKDYLTDTYGKAEAQAKLDHPDWEVDRVACWP